MDIVAVFKRPSASTVLLGIVLIIVLLSFFLAGGRNSMAGDKSVPAKAAAFYAS
jgi:hypothetical protein